MTWYKVGRLSFYPNSHILSANPADSPRYLDNNDGPELAGFLFGVKMHDESLIERFWIKVKIGNPDECWEWIACKHPRGYGMFQLDRRCQFAHRISWEISHKTTIPNGLHILHKCDNTSCVNPNHLFIGTHVDNMHDMVSKGRAIALKGEQHHSAKLTRSQVDEIRYKYANTKTTQRRLAKEYDVNQATIWAILKDKHWK